MAYTKGYWKNGRNNGNSWNNQEKLTTEERLKIRLKELYTDNGIPIPKNPYIVLHDLNDGENKVFIEFAKAKAYMEMKSRFKRGNVDFYLSRASSYAEAKSLTFSADGMKNELRHKFEIESPVADLKNLSSELEGIGTPHAGRASAPTGKTAGQAPPSPSQNHEWVVAKIKKGEKILCKNRLEALEHIGSEAGQIAVFQNYKDAKDFLADGNYYALRTKLNGPRIFDNTYELDRFLKVNPGHGYMVFGNLDDARMYLASTKVPFMPTPLPSRKDAGTNLNAPDQGRIGKRGPYKKEDIRAGRAMETAEGQVYIVIKDNETFLVKNNEELREKAYGEGVVCIRYTSISNAEAVLERMSAFRDASDKVLAENGAVAFVTTIKEDDEKTGKENITCLTRLDYIAEDGQRKTSKLKKKINGVPKAEDDKAMVIRNSFISKQLDDMVEYQMKTIGRDSKPVIYTSFSPSVSEGHKDIKTKFGRDAGYVTRQMEIESSLSIQKRSRKQHEGASAGRSSR